MSRSLREAVLGISRAESAPAPLQTQVAELFIELREDVYRYLLTLGLHPPQAQEATQEVFLRLYVTLRRNIEVLNPRAWIFRVAHNYGLKVRARENSLRAFDPGVENRLRDRAATPEMTVIERERALRFHNAIENLSEQQKRCLFLRLEGLRYPEIAEAMGISASTVGEFIRRAIARLRKVAP
ncbi:MAG: sigma-70 family RNA polymerase sigma factor [Bryobacteraceae bacterium]|nr:sigma-70 family RNA polymerase sigma factor [Bryobacteraceae bacterium]